MSATALREEAEAIAASTPDVDRPPVHTAWARVMADVQAVGKTGRNESQNYSFRGVDAVMNAAGPAMRTHGVIVMPSLKAAHYRDVEVGKNRTLMREVTVEVIYSIIGPAGDVFVHPSDPDFGKVAAEAMDSGDKGTSKAMSVALRTFLIQALTLPTNEPDPDTQSYERSAAPEQGSPLLQLEDAKAVFKGLAEGDADLAKAAWIDLSMSTPWTEEALTAAFKQWVTAPKDGEKTDAE